MEEALRTPCVEYALWGEFGRTKLGVVTITVLYSMVTQLTLSTSWVVAPVRGSTGERHRH